MQLLGQWAPDYVYFPGLLGICIFEGSCQIWKNIQDKVGYLQQTVAEQCCKENLQREVEATITRHFA